MLPTLWKKSGSLFGPYADDIFERFFYGGPALSGETDVTWTPRVDVTDKEKEIQLDIELPGINKKDIKVEVKDNVLYISGERNKENKEENAEFSRIERHYGKFERTFGLPDTVDSANVEAKYKDGILTVTLNKLEKALPREIAVEVK